MPLRKKPERKPLGFFDARDRIVHLNNAYRVRAFTNNPLDDQSKRFERELSGNELPEPDEELEGSELSEGEWRQAMARERFRRDQKR
jgi:hypothetical protein